MVKFVEVLQTEFMLQKKQMTNRKDFMITKHHKEDVSFHLGVSSIAVALLAVGTLIATPAADAGTFKLVYNGSFSSADALNLQGSPTEYFSDSTPFTATALFDDASANLAAPIGVPGFVAYSPLSANLTVAGRTYNIATYAEDPVRGVTVAVFDDTTPFGLNHYAIGLLQNPVADGAGFIGDWLSASPPFNAAHLVTTVFTNYEGVGYGSGPNLGSSPTVVPIPLSDATSNPYLLTLGNYDEQLALGAPLNTVQLEAVPEPDSSIAMLVGLGLIGISQMFRRRNTAVLYRLNNLG